MVQLSGNSLSERHQELNTKVNEAVRNNINFDEIKAELETTDVDRLYKIDIAAKLKNIDYILDTLKSGDPLYVSRALKKATWLYSDEFPNITNTDYLHHNIFPFMSSKMKKKTLTAISLHLKDKDRVADFYNYCTQRGMIDLANKFLIHTSESFKLKLIQEGSTCIIDNKDETFLKYIFENNFVLFEEYFKQEKYNKDYLFCKFSYFYNVSDSKYLDLLEKHASTSIRLGLRISKDIVTKHKNRVLANPNLYVNILKDSKLLRHSDVSDAKIYAIGVLPAEASQFWNMHYYKKYKPILHAIPEWERYEFIKKIFTDKYPDEEFEMTKEFYDQNYNELMSVEEKEAWALRHITSDSEILGTGSTYIWYKFVNFEKAFAEIKKLILTATDTVKRLGLLKVLVQSAKTQRELEKLFKYYYERHINERRGNVEHFLKKVISVHNVLEFDNECWEAFNKIFYSQDVYADSIICDSDFKIIAIFYHILNKKEIPDSLKKHLEFQISMYSTKEYIDKLNEEKKQYLYNFITSYYLERVRNYEPGCQDHKCIAMIHFTLEFMAIYKKTKEDVPEAIMEFVNRDLKSFRYQQILQNRDMYSDRSVTEDDLVRCLKKDCKLVIDKISEVKDKIIHGHCYRVRLNRFFEKLKIYFSDHNVSQQYLKLFHDLLSDNDLYLKNKVVLGIFKLGDEKSNNDFMNKFTPTDPKIDDSNIDRNLLLIQEAICRFACYSRPPVLLSNILMYLKGDYVKYCLPMFHMYLSNLPQPQCLKFVESLLDAPVSIQKHGLRLAFKCFSRDELTKLILNTWKSSKNVSLRSVIYKGLYEKVVKDQDKEMYETLKALTLDLHDEDDDILSLITSQKLSFREYVGDFTRVVWSTVEKLKDNEENVNRKTAVIKLMDELIYTMNKETVTKIVSDYVNIMINKPELQSCDAAQKLVSLNLAKWDLVVHYIVYFTSTDEELSESIKLAKLIVGKCIEGWDVAVCEVYVHRKIFAEFIQKLKMVRFVYHPTLAPALIMDTKCYENASVVFQAILEDLLAGLPLHEIYMYVWELRVSLVCRQVVKKRSKFDNDNRVEVIQESATEYGKQLGNLVKEFVQNNIYVPYFTRDIASLIIKSAFDIEYHVRSESDECFDGDHILAAIAQGLLYTETNETNLLALLVFPTEPQCTFSLYKAVYDTIQKLPDIGTKCCLHQKFSRDFKRRRIE